MDNKAILGQKSIVEWFKRNILGILFLLSSMIMHYYIDKSNATTYGLILAYVLLTMMLVFILYLNEKIVAYNFMTLFLVILAQSLIIWSIFDYMNHFYWMILLCVCISVDLYILGGKLECLDW